MKSIVLASQSPRRKELLELGGFEFMVCSCEVDETLNPKLELGEAMEALALRKALPIKQQYPEAIVIGADTIVVVDGEVLGKPKDEKDAYAMLLKLSGKTHQVITSTAILYDEEKTLFHSVSDVSFYSLNSKEIQEYLDYGEYKDKAGSYAIQGRGATLVERINGDYYAIVGLPIVHVTKCLNEIQNKM